MVVAEVEGLVLNRVFGVVTVWADGLLLPILQEEPLLERHALLAIVAQLEVEAVLSLPDS